MRHSLAFLIAACLLPLAASAAEPVQVPLDAGTLTALPHEPVVASAHGHTLHCDGIPLHLLLRAAGAMPAELRGPALARYVQADARDGYRVVFSLAEVDPALGNHRVFLVDRCDGAPLPESEGPLRLVAPDESRPARWIRQVETIRVLDAP